MNEFDVWGKLLPLMFLIYLIASFVDFLGLLSDYGKHHK